VRSHVTWGGWALACAACAAAIGALAGCAIRGPAIDVTPTLRLSDLASVGDATRRASLQLVIDGLDADARGDARLARGFYARALQVDSSNPYAYLAIARHHAEGGNAPLTLEHLARTEELLDAADRESPRVEVHLTGLRGVALRLEGRSEESNPLLAQAATAAPSIWGDGVLGASELR
jgi:hypothetical protein